VVAGLELAQAVAAAAGADPVLVAALAAGPAAPVVPEAGAQKRPIAAVDPPRSTASAMLISQTD
jgi:hypothetical protein